MKLSILCLLVLLTTGCPQGFPDIQPTSSQSAQSEPVKVPEPETASMVLLGLASLFFVHKVKERK